jgi:hypothetical protein
MPDQPHFTNSEWANRFRVLAKHASGPDQSRYLSLAVMYDRQETLIGSSLRAIVEAKELIAKVDKLQADSCFWPYVVPNV